MKAKTMFNSALTLVKAPTGKNKPSINKTVQTLLNGYEQPAILSNAKDGHIVFLNEAAQHKMGLSYNRHADKKLGDLFNSQRIINQDVIWERQKKKFEVSEEKLEIDGKEYIHSVIKPLNKSSLNNLQKEMAKLLVHRFHSPLNGVTGFTELLKDLSLTEKQEKYINSIETGLDDFKEILAKVNELAQDIDVRLASINVKELKSKILALYSSDERKKIDVAIDSAVNQLRSDPILLKAMVKELLDNALKFGDHSQGKIKIHFKSDHTIRVTNYGTPIPKSKTRKIFYPFFSSKARDIGLGLAKCVYYGQALGYQTSLTSNSSAKGISFDIQMK